MNITKGYIRDHTQRVDECTRHCRITTQLVLKREIRERADLLYILGPFRGVTEGHESTVGQDGEHDQYAEHRGHEVKELSSECASCR